MTGSKFLCLKKHFFGHLFFLAFITSNAWSQEKLIFAIDLIRHGDRTPLHTIPKSPPYHWPEGEGQLTPEGMQQAYQLGVQLRKKYINQFHLLPSHYDAQMIYVRSTDYDRTLMSAESLLMGLYPLGTGPNLSSGQPALPHNYQPIPIHTVPKEDDDIFIPDINRKQFKELLKYVISREWKEKNANLQNHYAAWSKATGEQITGLQQLASLADTFYIDQLHHVPLPPDLSSEEVKKIIQAGNWALAAAYRSKEIGAIMGNKLLAVIMDYLQQAAQHKTSLKYVLLSAHDTTILSLMSALGAPLEEPPHYASDLNFALFEISSGNYIVKVAFNGQPVNMPSCHGSSCTLPHNANTLSHGTM